MNPVPGEGEAILTEGGLMFIGCYLVSLLLLGVVGRLARKEKSMEDFYLGGRGIGMFVLLMTLYATQYSGNTLLGFAGRAYRGGFQFLASPIFMMAVIGGYLIYAPKLFRLSRSRKYITMSNYMQDRYGSRPLSVLVSLLGIMALCSYMLSNLLAAGILVETASGGRFAAWQGIVALSIIMVVYETLGGLRSVAWTDVLQGTLLLAGCGVIFYVLNREYDTLSVLTVNLREHNPGFWTPPTLTENISWLSSLILLGLGISLYPHAVQRIYAAKSETSLRRSLQIMVLMPFFTTFFMLVVGWSGAGLIPGLSAQESDSITILMINHLAQNVPHFKMFLVVFLGAVFAAIMSTVDSALLSLSSSITEDLYRPWKPRATEAQLTLIGKIVSWLLMGSMALLAVISESTIFRLVEIKLELLIQTMPALFLGIHSKRLRAGPVLGGMAAGTAFTLTFMIANKLGAPLPAKMLGIHAGLWGLFINMAVLSLMLLAGKGGAKEQAEA